MTTNGLTLTKLLVDLQRAGLNALNISLDTLKQRTYGNITRRDGRLLNRVLAGIDLALQLGFTPVKVSGNTINVIICFTFVPTSVRYLNYCLRFYSLGKLCVDERNKFWRIMRFRGNDKRSGNRLSIYRVHAVFTEWLGWTKNGSL